MSPVVRQTLARVLARLHRLFWEPSASSTRNVIYLCNYVAMAVLIFLSLLMWVVNNAAYGFLAMALTSLAGLLIAFIGGVHWGIGLRLGLQVARFHIVWGAIAIFGAWFGVLLLPGAGLPFLALMFVACYVVDHRVWPRVGMEQWLNLRFQGTVAAVLALIGAAATM